MKLGLIDGIGNAEQILREKFGEIVIKKFEKSKSFIAKNFHLLWTIKLII